MRISIICFSQTRYMSSEDLQNELQGNGYTTELYQKYHNSHESIAER